MVGIEARTDLKTFFGIRSLRSLFFGETGKTKAYCLDDKKNVRLDYISYKKNYGNPSSLDDLMQINVKSLHCGAKKGFIVAGKDTEFYSNGDWVKMSSLCAGQKVSCLSQSILKKGKFPSLIRAFLAGKSTIITSGNKGIFCLVNHKNKKYLHWKLNLLHHSTYMKMPAPNSKGEFRFQGRTDFLGLKNNAKDDWHKPSFFMKNHYSHLGLALLFGDYGCLKDGLIYFDLSRRYPDNIEPQEFALCLGKLGMACSSEKGVVILSPLSSKKIIDEVLYDWLPNPVRSKIPWFSEKKIKVLSDIINYNFLVDCEIKSIEKVSSRKFREINGLAGIGTVYGNIFAGSIGAQFLIRT